MTKTNLEMLPELFTKRMAHEANLRDILQALRDKVRAIRENKDPDTGKSIKDMIDAEKKAITTVTQEMNRCLTFPNQTNMDLQA